mgnify:CR=1 FL=1|tara:strand:+ start:462 stop:1334 length:873 start_codon:yes stop_codon:yes gene_type:complete
MAQKKVRGHRSNKPNDSFGTINNDNLYKNSYKADVYSDDDEENVEQQAQPEEEQTDPSFVSGEEKAGHDYKKRYDDLKRHYDGKIQEFKDKEKELEATLTQATRQHIPLPKSEEELEQFRQEFPDVYDVVETIATKKAGEKAQSLEQELESFKEKEQSARAQAAYQQLLNSHPDFDDIRVDEKFLSWLEDQPGSIADGILKNNTDAKLASRVIDLYKVDAGISKKRAKKSQADAAASVSSPKSRDVTNEASGDKRIFTATQIAKMKPWEFERLESEIDSARADGRLDLNS